MEADIFLEVKLKAEDVVRKEEETCPALSLKQEKEDHPNPEWFK
jgi:hypothetical protein